MFKIQIYEVLLKNNEATPPYVIRYELVPDISKGAFNHFIHQSEYKSLAKAKRVAGDLSIYLSDSYMFLDLVYTKLKQLEITLNQSEKYLRIDFNKVENVRVNLLKNSQKSLFAYDHIDNIKRFLSSLKYWCFAISKNYTTAANQLFRMLLDFESAFVNGYRSAEILSNNNQLKFFL